MKKYFQLAFIFLKAMLLFGISLPSLASHFQYSVNQVFAFKRIGQVAVSPNGNEVAFTTFQANQSLSGLKWEYSLYIKNKQHGMQLIAKDNQISCLSWSPDGNQLAYLTKGKIIWLTDIQSKIKSKLIEFNGEIQSLKWSPVGDIIAFSANAEIKKNPSIPIDVSKDYINTRLYLISTKPGNTAFPITSSYYSLSQFFIFPGFDWSPDGQFIAFSFQPQPGNLYSNDNKIGIINIKKPDLKIIPYTKDHTGIQPFFSPDGKWIAFKSNRPISTFATDLINNIDLFGRVCITNTETLESHCLADTPNGDPTLLGWNQSSNQIFVLDNDKSNGLKIYTININSSIPVKLISTMDGFIEPLTITLNNSRTYFGFGFETPSKAPEVYISSVDLFKFEKITDLNSLLNKNPLGNTKVIHWKSQDGMNIEGLLLTPVNYDAKKKYPLYVAVHGGPKGTWWQRYLGGCDEYENMIDPSTCWANLLSMGFVVLQPNPRGSSGYGVSFGAANYADFGGGDYQDIMSGVDFVINKGIADASHLAIGGWSFGGYMTVWAISQNNRFKSAIDGDGNTNFISFSGTSDIPNYYINYLGSTFWDNSELYVKRAPISYVQKISTPLLILEGENDHRVPPGQAYELYTALKMQRKPVSMLLLPGQGHVPSDPNMIYGSIQAINTWLKKAL